MYEIIKNKIVHAVTIRSVVYGILGILLVYLIGSLEHLDAARGEIERGLELIERIERANQTQQTNRATP